MVRMMKLTILLAMTVIAQQAYCGEPARIVGSGIAIPGQFPYQVSLQFFGSHICGGSIISYTHILTAAHCIRSGIHPHQLSVVTRITNLIKRGQFHRVKCILIHPDYTGEKENGLEHDIALITLRTPIEMSNVQGPIPLASKNHINGGYRGIISGWVRTSALDPLWPHLIWTGVTVLSQERCLDSHENPATNTSQICITPEKVGKIDFQGEGGAPLVVDGELVGVGSWGAMGIFDVYTNIYKYLDFIEESQSICE